MRPVLTTMLQEESRIYVESEDEPDRLLLETKIGKDDGYQKQQGNCFRQKKNLHGMTE